MNRADVERYFPNRAVTSKNELISIFTKIIRDFRMKACFQEILDISIKVIYHDVCVLVAYPADVFKETIELMGLSMYALNE